MTQFLSVAAAQRVCADNLRCETIHNPASLPAGADGANHAAE